MDFHVLVIGSGPGGYVAAIRAAQLGNKVGIVERAELGGICLNWGCIPTKALLRSAEVYHLIKHSQNFGFHVENYSVDFPKIIKRSRDVAGRLSKGVAFLMRKNKIEVIQGHGKLTGANEVEVTDEKGNTRKVTAEKILIATGARARQIPGLETDGERVLTYKEAMVMKELPKSIAIVGAGAIGVEFAYFFRTLGAEVTLIEMMPQILPIEDEEIGKELEKSFKKQGMKIHTGTRVEKLTRGKKGVKLTVSKDGKSETVSAEYALMAIGVQGNIEDVGLETVGVEVENGWIKVNEFYQTNVPHIYAIGDIIGPPWLAHVASKEGIIAVEHMSGQKVVPLDYNAIPGCTYCNPQVASVGLTEKKAREAGYQLKIGKFPIRANGKALGMGESEGFIKIIYDEKYGELLGCHIIGPEATELITEVTLAKSVEATYMEVLHTVHPHPTLSEIVAEATHAALGEPIHI
ncbi:MAG: dihydrolipoyl dehydrogenase [Calditrichaeota bacterium]|nr:MAG: dihydrolipoyl dehydrogenase [Calditrichota bacterium]